MVRQNFSTDLHRKGLVSGLNVSALPDIFLPSRYQSQAPQTRIELASSQLDKLVCDHYTSGAIIDDYEVEKVLVGFNFCPSRVSDCDTGLSIQPSPLIIIYYKLLRFYELSTHLTVLSRTYRLLSVSNCQV